MFNDLQTPPNTTQLAWLLPYQQAQDIHDRLYCSDVAYMSPDDRCVILVLLMAKYLTNIQADMFTSNNAVTTGKRVTDILITSTSILTAMKVSISERLEKIGVPDTVTNETGLMQWLDRNYVFELGPNNPAAVNDVYDRNMQFAIAMPVQMHKAIEAIECIKLMQPSTNARAVLVNACMHLWIQCVICHTRHHHRSFVQDIIERMHEVESKSIHSQSFGFFPNYTLERLYR